MRQKVQRIFVVLSLLWMLSCTKKDTSNIVPSLEFNYFQPLDIQLARLTLNFQDGDGDLFRLSGSTEPNFYIEFEYKDSAGNFKPVYYPIVLPDTIIYQKVFFTYTVFQPKNLADGQYIKGNVIITMSGWRPNPGYKKFRYKIYAIDRKGNKSNELITNEISVPI